MSRHDGAAALAEEPAPETPPAPAAPGAWAGFGALLKEIGEWLQAEPWRMPLLLAVVAALFRLPGLGQPAEEVFDEVYHAKAALQYLQGLPPTEWVHPPTAKLIIAIGVAIWGYVPWAWRLMPALAGIALAPVFYLLAREVTGSWRATVLACVLLLCDGVYLVQSRIAMTNIFAVLFQVSSALLVLKAVRRPVLPVGLMIGAGFTLGLALSTRWTSLWAWGFMGLVLLVGRRLRLFTPRELGLSLVTFALIPAAVYLAAYVPWMYQQHFDLSSFAGWGVMFTELVNLQKGIWHYHATLNATHPYFSRWYTWPFLYRPTWYHFKVTDHVIRGIVAIGNPALWWASVPVTAWALLTLFEKRIDWRRVYSGAGFVCLYLPWGISPRTLNYSHYLFEAIPYACLSLGMLLDSWWDDAQQRWSARLYVGAAVFLFFFFLPFLLAIPIPESWYYFRVLGGVRPWTWFPTWV